MGMEIMVNIIIRQEEEISTLKRAVADLKIGLLGRT